jgi:glyoxylase-like metal-dependent hydrolase (beta-lactamase superfamily II)
MSIEILEGIWQVGGGELSAPEDAASYLVACGSQAVLIDAGSGLASARLAANIRGCLPRECRLSALVLTHCHFDHSGGAEAVRGEFGCRILAHAEDARFLEAGDNGATAASWYGATLAPLHVDELVQGSHGRLAAGSDELQLHHWPGHSPGSLVCTLERGGLKVLFGQDVHGPLHPMLHSNALAYRRSLQLLLELEADILCEGHFGVIRGRQAVARFIRQYLSAAP